ncbi:MAG: PQQ-binding-like beta-propeller repeat protein [Bacillota bacterium]
MGPKKTGVKKLPKFLLITIAGLLVLAVTMIVAVALRPAEKSTASRNTSNTGKNIDANKTAAPTTIISPSATVAPIPTVRPPSNEPLVAGVFPEVYTDTAGVLTFRGNNFRSSPAYGIANIEAKTLTSIWTVGTQGGSSSWGGGVCWTGQPALVQWDEVTKQHMNIKAKFKLKTNFVEVIQATMSGKIYFLDLETGEQTRDPITTNNPIKGSVSIDSRGYPLMYVGQGIKEGGKIGIHLFNLINQKELYFINVQDGRAPRGWPGCDGSALFNRADDTMFIPSENGLVYKLKLNTKYVPESGTLSINPTQTIFNTRSTYAGSADNLGTENSAAAYKNMLYFGDNNGTIRCITTDMKLKWKYKNLDDTDASIVLEVENGTPFIYSGCEVDKQGSPGNSRIVKLNANTGEEIWKHDYKCYSSYGASPSNGGLYGTPVLGKNDLSNLLIFTLCRYPSMGAGAMIAIDKSTGETVWENKMTTRAWSSPVDVYTSAGKGYIVHVDRDGNARIIDGLSGKVLFTKNFDSYVEASPAIFNDYMVIASRNSRIYGFKLN